MGVGLLIEREGRGREGGFRGRRMTGYKNYVRLLFVNYTFMTVATCSSFIFYLSVLTSVKQLMPR